MTPEGIKFIQQLHDNLDRWNPLRTSTDNIGLLMQLVCSIDEVMLFSILYPEFIHSSWRQIFRANIPQLQQYINQLHIHFGEDELLMIADVYDPEDELGCFESFLKGIIYANDLYSKDNTQHTSTIEVVGI